MRRELRLLLSIFILTFFISGILYAQNPDERTTLILSSGDTIIGKVSKVYPRYNMNEIKSKTYGSVGYSTYNANQIQSVSSNKIALYTNEVNNEKLLMSLAVLGDLSLYETYTIKGYKRFFVKKNNGKITELTPENYLDILGELVTACTEEDYLFYKKNIKYNSKDISEFISKYNACILPNKYAETDYSTQYAITIQVSPGFQVNSIGGNPNFSYASNTSFAPGTSLRTLSDRKVNYGLELYWVRNEVNVITGPTRFAGGSNTTNYRSSITWFNPYLIFNVTPKIGVNLGPKIGYINYQSIAKGLNTGFSTGINVEILPRVSLQAEYQYTNGRVERDNFTLFGQDPGDYSTGQVRIKLSYNLIY
jgi:hypothetical protein